MVPPGWKPSGLCRGIGPHWRASEAAITLGGMLAAGQSVANDRHRDLLPAEPVRALVTIALVFLLIGIVLAIATNTLSGASPLLGRVKSRVFSPVLVPAWLDVGYDYRITYGLEEDADHEIDLRVHGADGPGLLLPGPRAGERASRWRRLARTIAVGGIDDDGAPVAAGVARGGFIKLGADDLDVRVFRLPQPERSAAARGDTEQVHASRVRQVGGDVQLIRDEPPGELAPLATAAPPTAPPVPAEERP